MPPALVREFYFSVYGFKVRYHRTRNNKILVNNPLAPLPAASVSYVRNTLHQCYTLLISSSMLTLILCE